MKQNKGKQEKQKNRNNIPRNAECKESEERPGKVCKV